MSWKTVYAAIQHASISIPKIASPVPRVALLAWVALTIPVLVALAVPPPGRAAEPVADGVDLYRWSDPDGRVHYGDRPPPGQPVYELHQSGPPMIGDPVPQSARQSPATRSNTSAARSSPVRRRTQSRSVSQRGGDSRECAKLESRIAAIEATMRKGYREPRGNKLRQQRRRLSEQFYSQCYR